MDSVILYQMGKVGSSTLKESLSKKNINALHIHRYYFCNNEKPIRLRRLIHKIKSNLIFNSIIKREKAKIITFYRNPLDRNISSFFQNLDIYFSKREFKNLSYKQLEEKFNNASKLFETPTTWFDVEFNKRLEVDIFNYPINKDKGYTIFSKGNIDFFVCTTENINNLEKEFGQFLGITNFKLINKNIGSKKWYYKLYKEFKENYTPPSEMLNKLYNSKTIHHFYTDEEIKVFKDKYMRT